MDLTNWRSEEVSSWLESVGFGKYSKLLCEEHLIDGNTLLQISEEDLRLPPVSIKVLGDIKQLMKKINELKSSYYSTFILSDLENFSFQNVSTHENIKSSKRKYQLPRSKSADSVRLLSSTGCLISSFLEPEFTKLFIAFCYASAVFILTTFVMVVVHDRVPNMDRYPPLPDIVLDNVPHIPWAFDACEAIILILGFFLFLTLLFHRHRFIIMRRIFALSGTVFLLRCITMLLTSLSVPGTHLQCEPRAYGNFSTRVEMALKIYSGFGMSLQGVRSCGDYMFSGHTVAVTIANFFLTEYTPRNIPMLHILAWVGNFFSIFFILAAHEHYSIDVFVAFYITSRLFLYYHSLANNKVLLQKDFKTRLWFPLFAFFESSMDGSVPNEFELPWVSFYNYINKWYKTKMKRLKKTCGIEQLIQHHQIQNNQNNHLFLIRQTTNLENQRVSNHFKTGEFKKKN